jgi:UDP-N-acetylglucosamine:LPS N-acetylglucosamine transferase
VASAGGHLAQLRLIVGALPAEELAWVIAEGRGGGAADESGRVTVCEANARAPWAAVRQAFAVSAVVLRLRPRVVISTGASVGVWAVVVGRLLGARTVWIDSVANRGRMSLSARLVRPFATHWLTQSEAVAARTRARYVGNVLG